MTTVTNASALDRLPPLHLPESVSWWPPAPGWWAAAVLALLAAGAAAICTMRWWRRGRLRRLALAEARALVQRYRRDGDGPAYLRDCNALLKRFALQQFPDAHCAALSGERWLEALDSLGSDPSFVTGSGRQLLRAYAPSADVDAEALHQVVDRWLRRPGTAA